MIETLAEKGVLPLTREWIEMLSTAESSSTVLFSLLRGSGLKFIQVVLRWAKVMFSLLRGSGLKFQQMPTLRQQIQRSPSYEGVDWNGYVNNQLSGAIGSPSYEGVDWNGYYSALAMRLSVLPLTREWIEISAAYTDGLSCLCSPSYEGVDWNVPVAVIRFSSSGSPSYEGVDWNSRNWGQRSRLCSVLPLTREWIEI